MIDRIAGWVASARRLVRNLALALRSQHRRHGWIGMLRRLPGHAMHWRRHLRVLTAPHLADAKPFVARADGPRLPLRPHPDIDGTDERLEFSVSVVIPTLNAGAEFGPLLRKLAGQRGLNAIEIVVVDSGSNDGTVALARECGAQVVEIAPAEFTHSHARNVGADAASGEFLVFMVQDAYPIGDLWLYGMLRWLLDHRDAGVVAASCSEYCRADSDLMYDSMVQTHYRFLGCLDADRIGRLTGTDHMALRSMGQLSDVACLIGRDTFQRYRYRGDYAEDLDLGIRLIRDGHRVAMLASVKVIHSHRRPAHYYLKRSFVDVIFLVGLFDDFHAPRCESLAGLIDGVETAATRVAAWLQALPRLVDAHGVDALAPRVFTAVAAGAATALGDARLDAFVSELVALRGRLRPDHAAARPAEAQRFVDSVVARADHFQQFVASVYGVCDERLREEFAGAMTRIFASALGAALAYLYLDRRRAPADDAQRQWIDGVFAQLRAGV